MANKTPPLVIPVVIDSTGVDKGLSNVGNRLRRGVSGTGAGGGAGGGFGAGGALAAAALGAGVAAAAGRKDVQVGAGRKARELRQERYNQLNNSNMLSKGLDKFAGFAFRMRENYHGAARQMMASRGSHLSPADMALNPAYQDLMAKGDWWGGGWGYGKNPLPVGQRFRGVGMMAKYASTGYAKASGKLARGVDSLLSLRSAVGVGAVAAVGTGALNFAQNFRQNTSDISNLQGSPLYGMMREVQRRNFKSGPQPTFLQSMLGGSLTLSRGQETYLEKDAKAVVAGIGNVATGLGLAYEYARSTGISGTLHAIFLKGFGL